MIGEYLESVKTELETEFPELDTWIVDDAMMPREPEAGQIRAILEAETGTPFADNTRTLDGKRVSLLTAATTVRLESLLGNAAEGSNPHTEMMTKGANILDWVKDASFAYQSDVCDPVEVSSELDIFAIGFSIVMARWNATVVARWADETVHPRITGVQLNITAQFPQ